MNRLDDPPLMDEMSEASPLSDQQAEVRMQAQMYLWFLSALEAGGLPHAEALWLTAQVWRAG